ncbi:UDP-N-acetylmuramoyl-L-alanyl-D-glutamate--2,6-diaminopimelate ligase [Candidatus Daviesbacteria bacterium]|nr:UDP-N-acetylmuramoyl-L-alanyl-D-glutamate--2,6-diaminopimelate ligase [Candidatus Daviesbacteria bacterium]
MVRKLKSLVPQKVKNYAWHFPKANIANLRFGFPAKGMIVIGVTGTDGKTTTTNMIYQILKNAGKKVSMISTINAMIGDESFDTGFHITSPNASDLQKYIRKAKEAESKYLVLEVTSNGLDQFRVLGIKFEIGVITNITHEHLDYHKTWENYFKTKAKLIKNVNIAVINKDEKHFERLSKLTKGKVVSFGLHKNSDFNPLKFPLNLKIPGEYNLLNALAGAAVSINLKVPSKIVKDTLNSFKSLPGRMEEIENNKGIKIIVDFAHTPNGLEQALKTLQKFKKGNLVALIGAEGDRDTQKRALMGEIAVKLADKVIITSVDPRGEVEQINKQILEGVKKAGGNLGEDVFVENDREKAIRMAIEKLAKKGDILAIFGKGHEKSMNLDGKNEIAWSDADTIRKILNG